MHEGYGVYNCKMNAQAFYGKETVVNLTPWNNHPSIISKNMANLFNVENIFADADTMDNVCEPWCFQVPHRIYCTP